MTSKSIVCIIGTTGVGKSQTSLKSSMVRS
ncbi:unnamed protein product [Kuraishia capsulata CBS 1993]|uniref:Uncharacterized protein n=1 Tax=Kuraishia capsulata CBS 1993 TaxID=1382522 RepID=W6MQ15_9ASCO|nr:uncharacterized protein KUCA_T00004400001 [Kuraishia capsulata CBS 1993]CDK28418.1 unnamed protein product [Kuraishia capsulata CBS 1993]